jgi:hypothetical protein
MAPFKFISQSYLSDIACQAAIELHNLSIHTQSSFHALDELIEAINTLERKDPPYMYPEDSAIMLRAINNTDQFKNTSLNTTKQLRDLSQKIREQLAEVRRSPNTKKEEEINKLSEFCLELSKSATFSLCEFQAPEVTNAYWR